MKKYLFIAIILVYCLIFSSEVKAFWIWTPKSNKLINPKNAAKDTPREQFKWAMRFFKDEDYKRAAEEFVNLAVNFKDSHLAPDAQYYAGRAYEASGKYYPAFQAYQKTIDTYPFTERIDDIIEREYNLGNILYKKHAGKLMGKEIITDLERAAEIFAKVKENAPFGEYADKAQFMIGECLKKSEQHGEAAKAFQKLAEEYPNSELVDKAKYEVAQATYLASLKPDYDQDLTDEAIKEFERVAREGEELAISSRAKEAISVLEDKKAESLFKTAKFYESQKRYKSAAIYYEEIVKKYPKSSFYKPARGNMEGIAGFLRD
jgi:outer membrane assembly lipoprotein YfiO